LDAPLILLFFILLPPIVNLFIITFIETFEIKIKKGVILFLNVLNMISLLTLFLFIALTILLLGKVYSHWIDLGVIKEFERGLI
jgi:hypothetical protein